MTEVTDDQLEKVIKAVKEELRKDMTLAMANFKLWLLGTILSNIILIGVPALYVFFSTETTAQTAMKMAMDSRDKLDDRLQWITRTDARISALERQLHEKDGYDVPTAPVIPR